MILFILFPTLNLFLQNQIIQKWKKIEMFFQSTIIVMQ